MQKKPLDCLLRRMVDCINWLKFHPFDTSIEHLCCIHCRYQWAYKPALPTAYSLQQTTFSSSNQIQALQLLYPTLILIIISLYSVHQLSNLFDLTLLVWISFRGETIESVLRAAISFISNFKQRHLIFESGEAPNYYLLLPITRVASPKPRRLSHSSLPSSTSIQDKLETKKTDGRPCTHHSIILNHIYH
jgi:hypothetical protein